MNKLKILVVCPDGIHPERRESFEKGKAVMERYGDVKVDLSFINRPDFLNGVKIENGTDLDEDWMQNRLNDLNYHIVHVDVTPERWSTLGLSKTLYGQSQVVYTKFGRQAVQWGRWDPKATKTRAYRYLPYRMRRQLDPLALGFWHETDHSVRGLLGLPTYTTHYYFYGYSQNLPYAQLKELKLPRYELKPRPEIGWASLPFENLETFKHLELKQRANLLIKLVGLWKKVKEYTNPPKYPADLLPIVRRKYEILENSCRLLGIPIRMTEGVRSCARQNELYAQGRTKAGRIVTNAKCGQSFHQYGVALDIVFTRGGYNVPNKTWERMAVLAESLGFEWGGRWNGFVDKPHLQYTLGYSLSDFQNGKVDYSKFN